MPPLRLLFEVVIHVAGGGAVPSVLVATPLEAPAQVASSSVSGIGVPEATKAAHA